MSLSIFLLLLCQRRRYYLFWPCLYRYLYETTIIKAISAPENIKNIKHWIQTWLYIWVTRWVFYRKQELLTLREQLGSPLVFDGSVLLIFLAFCVVLFFFVGLNHVSCVNYINLACQKWKHNKQWHRSRSNKKSDSTMHIQSNLSYMTSQGNNEISH
jgi:hypothetical protein